jgi:nickel-dependent lactate racemase
MQIQLPYGQSYLTGEIPDNFQVDFIEPQHTSISGTPKPLVHDALDNLMGSVDWADLSNARSAAIAISDKTRPVPLDHLLPPLLEHLQTLGIEDHDIRFYVAVGAHPPMAKDEIARLLPEGIASRYPVISHDCENEAELTYLGKTSFDTPIWVNQDYQRSDVKIVVGNIEPHQFVGFSGGAKGAAIGLAGLATINHNHAMMTQVGSQLGQFENNPVRQDIEEIGQKIGVHLVLNAILNQDREIVKVLAGEPGAVMRAGIPWARKLLEVPVAQAYPLLISSPGGHPKDINVYQSQKALAHAARIMQPGGTIILTAACPEGSGSSHYEAWVSGRKSNSEVMQKFAGEGFHIGPHKAYLIARDATRYRLLSCTDLEMDLAKRLLLNPIENLQSAIDSAVKELQSGDCIGILAHANATIPYVENKIH